MLFRSDVETLLVGLCENPDKVEEMKERVRNIEMKSVKQMSKEYENLYQGFVHQRKLDEYLHKEAFLEAFRMEKNQFYGDAGIVAERRLERTVDELSYVITQKSEQLQESEEQYEKLITDYGTSMERLDRIRSSWWYKLYCKIRRR